MAWLERPATRSDGYRWTFDEYVTSGGLDWVSDVAPERRWLYETARARDLAGGPPVRVAVAERGAGSCRVLVECGTGLRSHDDLWAHADGSARRASPRRALRSALADRPPWLPSGSVSRCGCRGGVRRAAPAPCPCGCGGGCGAALARPRTAGAEARPDVAARVMLALPSPRSDGLRASARVRVRVAGAAAAARADRDALPRRLRVRVRVSGPAEVRSASRSWEAEAVPRRWPERDGATARWRGGEISTARWWEEAAAPRRRWYDDSDLSYRSPW